MNQNKRKFNIIDVVLILAILSVIVGVAVRSGFTGKLSQKLDEGHIEYEFIINSIKASSSQHFEVGTKLYSQSTQKEVGEIISVTTRTAEAYIELPNGEIVKTFIPDRIDVIGKAKVKGNLDSDGRCLLDGTNHIAAGKNIFARTEDITFMFTVEGAVFVAAEENSDPDTDTQKQPEAPVQDTLLPEASDPSADETAPVEPEGSEVITEENTVTE